MPGTRLPGKIEPTAAFVVCFSSHSFSLSLFELDFRFLLACKSQHISTWEPVFSARRLSLGLRNEFSPITPSTLLLSYMTISKRSCGSFGLKNFLHGISMALTAQIAKRTGIDMVSGKGLADICISIYSRLKRALPGSRNSMGVGERAFGKWDVGHGAI